MWRRAIADWLLAYLAVGHCETKPHETLGVLVSFGRRNADSDWRHFRSALRKQDTRGQFGRDLIRPVMSPAGIRSGLRLPLPGEGT